jgi:hypothetical protein
MMPNSTYSRAVDAVLIETVEPTPPCLFGVAFMVSASDLPTRGNVLHTIRAVTSARW